MQYVHYLNNQVLVIKLEGDFLGDTEDQQLLRHITHYLKFGVRKLLIDLSEVEHMNSSGLSVLIRIFNEVRSQQAVMVLINPLPHINKLLKVTKLTNILQVAANHAAGYQLLQFPQKK